jgi:hypothetical protein
MSQICPQTLSTGTSSILSLPPASATSLSTSNILHSNATTKIFIYIDSNRDDANEPFSIKLNKLSTSITLDDFLLAIPRPYTRNYKYFFKSIDPVLGVIREEITDRQQILPSANGRIAAWLMPATLTQDTINDITTTTANTSYQRRTRQQDDSLFTSDTSASETTDVASQDSRDDDDDDDDVDDDRYVFCERCQAFMNEYMLDSHQLRKPPIPVVNIIDEGNDTEGIIVNHSNIVDNA